MSKIKTILSIIFIFTIWGCVSSAYPILLWWSRECVLYLIIIIKPEVWIINHCLGLGHETMVCAVCLTMFLLDFFLVYQADVSIFYTSNLYWWGQGWPVDGLPFPDTGCPVPDVSIYYMSNINELPDGILFHWFCKCTPPWMFLPLDIPSEYRPEHVTFGLLCVIFKFPSRIFCRRVPGFATDCPCGVWCRGLTTCLLYVGPPLEF